MRRCAMPWSAGRLHWSRRGRPGCVAAAANWTPAPSGAAIPARAGPPGSSECCPEPSAFITNSSRIPCGCSGTRSRSRPATTRPSRRRVGGHPDRVGSVCIDDPDVADIAGIGVGDLRAVRAPVRHLVLFGARSSAGLIAPVAVHQPDLADAAAIAQEGDLRPRRRPRRESSLPGSSVSWTRPAVDADAEDASPSAMLAPKATRRRPASNRETSRTRRGG